MKVKMLAMIVCSVVAGSAMGQNSDALNNARQKVSESEKQYSEGEQQYHDAAYELGSAVNGSSTQMHMNELGAERAQAYGEEYNAERAADYQQQQEQKAAQQREARRTEAQAVAKADAVMNSYDHPVTPSKAFGDSQIKANQQRTENQAVALADARMAEQDRQDKALGQATHKTNESHQGPLHVTASARPAAAHATGSHLDSSVADKEAAKIAQNDAAKAIPGQTQLAQFNIDRTSQQTSALAQAQEMHAHSIRFTGMSKQPAITLTASKPAVQAVKVDSKPHNSSINVAANSLNPDTKVTFNGKPTTAGALKPDTQVSVGINSAFIHTPKGGNNNVRSNSRNEHGTGNGADNAHASAFGGHSAGGGFHF